MGGVVYLHGFCSSSGSSKGQYLAGRCAELGVRVELPELDEGSFRNTTLTRQLAVVRRTVEECQPALVIGSSLGGYLAALHAAGHPAGVRRLLLLAPAFDFAERLAASLGPLTDRWQQTGSLPFYHYRSQRELDLGYEFLRDAFAHEPTPAVTVPALVLHGTRDEVVDPEVSREFARRSPGATLEWVDTDHGMLDAREHIWARTRELLGLGAG